MASPVVASPVGEVRWAGPVGLTAGAAGSLGVVAGVAGGLGVVAAAVYRAHAVLTSPHRGLDLRPLYDAGAAVVHGRSPYDIEAFVYLPPAAYLWAVTAPLSLWTVRLAYLVVLLACVIAVTSATALLGAPARWRVVVAAVLSVVVLFSGTASWSLWLMNFSIVLAPAALASCWLFGRGSWWWGCAVLAATLVLKPLLLPLVLVPVFARAWRPLLGVAAGAGALLAVTLFTMPGSGQLPAVARRLAGGSVLVGSRAWNNLSLSGLAEFQHLPGAIVLAARVAVVILAVVVCTIHLRGGRGDVTWLVALSALLMLALLLAGPLSEVHYLFVVLPGVGAALALSRHVLPQALTGLALLLLLAPGTAADRALLQGRFVLAEVCLFLGLALAMIRSTDPDGQVSRERSASPGRLTG